MAVERTLSIIKPDAVAQNVIGEILARFEKAGLKIVAARMAWLSRAEAEGFYAVHRERPFFKALVDFMISGPVMIQVLEGENAIAKNRELMGATDPKKAAAGHDPRRFRAIDRRQRRSRLRRAGNGRGGNRLFLSRAGGLQPLGRTIQYCAMTNLLDLDPAGLAAFFAERGEKPFRAKQVAHWIHQRFADDVGAMTDLAKPLRETLAAEAVDSRAGRHQRHDGRRRHAQVAARRRQRQRRGIGLHSRGRPRHAVHFVAGRLRARLRVLLDRQAGLQPQPHDRRDHRPAVARQPRRCWRTASPLPGSSTAGRRSPTS